MATQVGSLVRDQNLNVHFDVAPLGAKTNVSKAQKNGRGLGGRKALNDISNSGRPSTHQTSKNHNVKKVQAGGRKALSDLTNSGKPHGHQSSKKSHGNKLGAVVEEHILHHKVAEEQFLHNHQECIKSQGKAVDRDYFFKTIGLDNDNTMQLGSPQLSPRSRKLVVSMAESPTRYSEIEEIPQELLFEDHSEWKKNKKMPSEETPCGSPKSPKHYVQWEDYNFQNFKLIESPKLSKH